ncbi:hypothetical protein AN964_19760 [Heyndrickxia shackletonii]|uniref:Uncharacterized protein n=1 Tax=Heyndrickxia shackletonii TaxID=157838 RepID=A0A0Q3TAR7_9BACI|nr:hypothetical protein [Heyndrickxia shackletonii]KQL51232.1 hypothetical protein AN964_19760 [Heyndrickxia shackletonii]NEY98499.1 hypothetical protein [Heyndrickxia shackletonii]
MEKSEINRGKPITFRIPSDTPDHILQYLGKLKETERRNFSSKIAEYVINGVGQSISKKRETLTIPLPKGLDKTQRNWLKHEQSLALLGSIVYQLLTDPVKTASLIASLNTSMVDVEDYPYPLEEPTQDDNVDLIYPDTDPIKEDESHNTRTDQVDDLDNFDWELPIPDENSDDEKEESMEDLLGDFLAQMNK